MGFNEHKCMVDSYKILTGKEDYKDMLDRDERVYLLFNPSRPLVPMENDVYDNVRQYFENIQDYEKCAEIHWAKCKAKNS
tara:strand:- start:614 stop:853 length:240 start_codon:yes stop_codon:yes gene_type:complete